MTVTICDVAARDGLQNLPGTTTPQLRAELVRRLGAAAVPAIEAVSFVNPRAVPQMSDPETVVGVLDPDLATRCCGLVLNERGYARLQETPLRSVRFVFAVSDTFNRRNANATTAEGLAAALAVNRRAAAEGMRTSVVLATAFGCPFEGEVDPGRVVGLASVLADAGVGEIILADTIGVAVPRQVRGLVTRLRVSGPVIGVHMHNTRNTGYLTTFAALESGAEVLDASLAGLGGCPFAPNATGNIATEDLVYCLEREGVETGIDLDCLIETAHWLEDAIDERGAGQLMRAGGFPPEPSPMACAIPTPREDPDS